MKNAPFAGLALGLAALGAAAAIVILAWPSPPIEPGGGPMVAFLFLVPIVHAIYAFALSAVFGLPAAAISLVRRERRIALALGLAAVDAAGLAVAGLVLFG